MLQHILKRSEDRGEADSVASPEALDWRMSTLLAALDVGNRDLAAHIMKDAMAAHDLLDVPSLVSAFASRTRASVGPDGLIRPPYPDGISPGLSAAKAWHDLRQLEWLKHSGQPSLEQEEAIDLLRHALRAFDHVPTDARLPWDSEAGRLTLLAAELAHRVRQSPRLPLGLSSASDWPALADAFRRSRFGVVIVDDFLAPEALTELRQFCLESTIWVGNRYPNGRLSSLLLNGFASPLLLQIAAELRDALPTIIGAHPLRQVWGFKYTQSLPASSTVHADSAAINVNFWITPEGANRDPDSGGMTIYGLEAPTQWDFQTYNRDIEAIRRYLALQRPTAIHIPYRCNRAIIFNSDLFHETDAVDFDDAYENHRINITMLYGDRVEEPVLQTSCARAIHAWRSGAFRRR